MLKQVLEHLRGLSGFNRKGEEIPDPRPVAMAVDIRPEMPLHEKVARAVQSHSWAQQMERQGLETFDEANDFDIPDELPEFRSFHEDEQGDVIAYEEGVRSGFIEEIPAERKEKARVQTERVRKYRGRGYSGASKDQVGDGGADGSKGSGSGGKDQRDTEKGA